MGTLRNPIDELLNEHDVARIIGLSVSSVRRRRLLRRSPKYIKLGSAVRYRPKDVESWIEAQVSPAPAVAEATR
jgi:predicted DNA-binding transcriptional regulator AlpA